MAVAGRNEPLSPNEELDHASNNLEFEFALLSFFKEDRTQYRTQLLGFDPTPTDWSSAPTRTYTNLPAGEFTFAVWARNDTWTIAGPHYLPFSVRPAPWLTWWAYLAYFVLAAGAVIAGTQWRLRTTRRRTEELERIVSARTAELAEARDEALGAKEAAIEASKAKSTFLANMSHELRTPLNAVIGFAQVLGRSRTLGRDDQQNLAIIQRAGEHLLGLINDILSISRIEAGTLVLDSRPFDLHLLIDTVEGMTRARAQAKRLRLSVEPDPSLPRFVRGDEGRLRQVLLNLLGNAVKFTDTGSVTLRARWSEGRAHFEVEDTGTGIAENELGKLFLAFSQTQSGVAAKEGTGLGLTISMSFVRLMGGTIHVISAPGKGSLFGFDADLPLAEGTGLSLTRKVTDLEPGQEFRILVVDDISENRRLLVVLLESVGFDVRGASNGAEAIDLWRSWRPDFIWMDMRMPGIDGPAATRTIRDEERAMSTGRRPTKIVGLTASAFESDREEFLRCGLDDFVPKPFREATIFEKLAEHLGVRYLYADHAEDRAARSEPLNSQRLVAQDPKLAGALRRALEAGDVQLARAVADRIREADDAFGSALLAEIRAFRLEQLLALFEEIESET
jgi:two-component system sensor histidine kinase/response regulator